MCIIIDNDYSWYIYSRKAKERKEKQEKIEKAGDREGQRKRDEEEEAYLFLFVPIFNVEFIARYTGNGGKDSTSKRGGDSPCKDNPRIFY